MNTYKDALFVKMMELIRELNEVTQLYNNAVKQEMCKNHDFQQPTEGFLQGVKVCKRCQLADYSSFYQ